jgi:L-fuculose-phosphate aldolase
LRKALVRAAQALERAGLNHGTSGNVSVREGDGMLITPSGIPAGDLQATQMVSLSLDGESPAQPLKPSSEWRLHAAVYANRDDIKAIVHTHSPYATAIACAREPLPAFHYSIAMSGADVIPCAGYATFGTAALAESLLSALGTGGLACLMANHGMLAAGADLDRATGLAEEIEFLARIYVLCRQVGEPVILDDAEMDRVRARIGDYGQG